jgi:uncharacterized membrane protein YcaP (DUF421 family)
MQESLAAVLVGLLGFGREGSELGAVEMTLRTVIVYVFTLVIVRLGSKRLLAKATAFDVIVAIMLGSVMSRAINGSGSFFPTLVAGTVLIGIHWLFALLAFHTDWLGALIKGRRVLLIKDGHVEHAGVRRGSITEADLEQALREQTGQTDPGRVQRAYLERSGKISVVQYKREPRVVDIAVEHGVQTVRVELE